MSFFLSLMAGEATDIGQEYGVGPISIHCPGLPLVPTFFTLSDLEEVHRQSPAESLRPGLMDSGLRFLRVKDHEGCRQETSGQSRWRRRGKFASSPHGRFQLGCQMVRPQSAELTEVVELMVPVQLKTCQNKISITIANFPARR